MLHRHHPLPILYFHLEFFLPLFISLSLLLFLPFNPVNLTFQLPSMSSGLPSDEVAEDYKNSLEDLTGNDKFQISNLTVIAKENTEHAMAISRVLENHIRTVGSFYRPCLCLKFCYYQCRLEILPTSP